MEKNINFGLFLNDKSKPMKLSKSLFFVLLLNFLFISEFTFSQDVQRAYEPNTLIVKVKPEYQHLFQTRNIDNAFGFKIEACRQLVKGQRSSSKSGINRIYKLKFRSDKTALQLSKELNKNRYFEYCEPNYYQELLYETNDPKRIQQYSLSIIQASQAWDITKGDSNIVIGITDTGIDFGHEDLKTNIAYNKGDIIDGIDNDNDGYVDNYYGWDFGDNDNNPLWNELPDANNIVHGVFVSGLAGARTDNAIGMSVIGFKTKILPVKISNSQGVLNSAYEGVLYAATHGCQIINCSWGGSYPSKYGADVISYVTEDLNRIVVAAAGNTGTEIYYYPASYNNVVSVTATNNLDQKWGKSTYNTAVDISAPGVNVLSTYPNGGFNASSGTSYASPIVAGALALLKAYYPDTLSNQQLVAILKNGTDLPDFYNEAFFHNKCGAGRLNVYKALSQEIGFSVEISDFELEAKFSQAPVNDVSNDTLVLKGILYNYLKSIENLKVEIHSNSSYVSLIDTAFQIDELSEEAVLDLSSFNLKLLISNDIPPHTPLYFTFKFTAEGYESEQLLRDEFEYPVIDYETSHFKTTFYPAGNVGRRAGQFGWGYTLASGENVLNGLGVMISASEQKMATNFGFSNSLQEQNKLDSSRTASVWSAENQLESPVFTDSYIKVKYENFLSPEYKGIVFSHYTFVNHSSERLDSLAFSLIADWDIIHSNNNYAEVDTALRLALTRCYNENITAGIQLLSPLPFRRYAVNNRQYTDDSGNLIDGFELENWQTYVRNNHYEMGTEGVGTDVVDVVSSGFFTLAPEDSITVSFAILVDTTASKVIQEAQKAKALYNDLYNSHVVEQFVPELKVYPNPNKGVFYIENYSDLPFTIYNTLGEIVHAFSVEPTGGKIRVDLSNQPDGIYFIQQAKQVSKIIKY